MEQVELISLYDYLGYAAGAELGKQVATAATRAKEQFGKRAINNTRYKGEVLLYRREFLKEYFNKQQNPDIKLSVSDHQDYNQWLTNNMNETTTTLNGYSGILTTIGSSGTGLTISGNSSYSISNSNNMSKQVKVAVFTVERDDKGAITSSKFVKEFWVEQKNGSSIVLAASKQLDKDFNPDTTVIREVGVVNF